MINRVGKMCVAAMSLCMIVLIVTRKRGDRTLTLAFFFYRFVMVVRKNVLEYIIALAVAKNKVRLKSV
jgi:membrane-associated PAP2 superfamily phosphatase